MTLQGLNDAKYWRDCAAEMRVLSIEMKDFEARTLMLKLANDYDKLATHANPTNLMRNFRQIRNQKSEN